MGIAKRRARKYSVYDGDQLVFEGSRSEVTKYIGRSETYIFNSEFYHTKIDGRYIVERNGYTEIEYDQPKRKKDDSTEMENDPFEFLKWHLTYKGNTSVVFDPEPYLPRLKEIGIECKVSKIRDMLDLKKKNKQGRKPKEKWNYLVEVVHAERGSQSV